MQVRRTWFIYIVYVCSWCNKYRHSHDVSLIGSVWRGLTWFMKRIANLDLCICITWWRHSMHDRISVCCDLQRPPSHFVHGRCDNCKDHFCIGNAFYVSICGGFFCNKAMKDLPCSEVRWPQWHSGDQGSLCTDNCEILLFASNLFNFRLVGCASALLCWF